MRIEPDYTLTVEELKEQYKQEVIKQKLSKQVAPDDYTNEVEQTTLDKPISPEQYDQGVSNFYDTQAILEEKARLDKLKKLERIEKGESPLLYGFGGDTVVSPISMSMKEIIEFLAEKERKEKEEAENSPWKFG